MKSTKFTANIIDPHFLNHQPNRLEPYQIKDRWQETKPTQTLSSLFLDCLIGSGGGGGFGCLIGWWVLLFD